MSLLRVSDVNWSDNTICRSGVIPIHDDGTNKWIGFGITNFSTNITTIGGRHESDDYDLLTTAVREYNEEVGSNLPSITEEDVGNLYAIKSSMILILLPISNIPAKFVKTEELADMLWVTPGQIKQIIKNSNFFLSESSFNRDGDSSRRTPAYIFSVGVLDVMNNVSKIVEEQFPFKQLASVPFFRSKKIYMEPRVNLINSLDDFAKDVANSQIFYGHVALTIHNKTICIMRHDRSVYLFPLEYSAFIIPRIPCYILMATRNERNRVIESLSLRFNSVGSVEHLLDRDSISIKSEFINKLDIVESYDNEISHVIMKLNLIFEYETKIYKENLLSGSRFNYKRATFLSQISYINQLITQETNPSMKQNREILELMTDMGLIHYDFKSSKYVVLK